MVTKPNARMARAEAKAEPELAKLASEHQRAIRELMKALLKIKYPDIVAGRLESFGLARRAWNKFVPVWSRWAEGKTGEWYNQSVETPKNLLDRIYFELSDGGKASGSFLAIDDPDTNYTHHFSEVKGFEGSKRAALGHLNLTLRFLEELAKEPDKRDPTVWDQEAAFKAFVLSFKDKSPEQILGFVMRDRVMLEYTRKKYHSWNSITYARDLEFEIAKMLRGSDAIAQLAHR